MKFGEAISSAFSNYANFKGRTRRSGYWFFYLFYVIVIFAAAFLDALLFGTSSGLLYTVSVLALVLPSLSTAVRRLHDVDKSGWFILVPIYNLILLLQDSQRGPNRFGDPVK
jgi:uncharacterized membrane protein YhaH (DUF805 family)